MNATTRKAHTAPKAAEHTPGHIDSQLSIAWCQLRPLSMSVNFCQLCNARPKTAHPAPKAAKYIFRDIKPQLAIHQENQNFLIATYYYLEKFYLDSTCQKGAINISQSSNELFE